MQIFKKEKLPSGHRNVYLYGLKIASYKKSFSAEIQGEKNNHINIPLKRNIKIAIKGKNNIINIDKDIDEQSCIHLEIVGDNNKIDIKKSLHMNINLRMGYDDGREVYNTSFLWGKNSLCNGAYFYFLENNTSITVGDECMFSFGIEVRCTDDHTVLDMNNNVLNRASSITIGNHVWICHDVTIMKNTAIPDNCIVALKSIVTKKFTKSNCVIAGVPAKVVKENINWNEVRPDLYKQFAE